MPLEFSLEHKETIRKIIGSFFLLLLIISITPKIILHNIVANHHDISVSTGGVQHAELNKAGINCHFDNIVCESPFLPIREIFIPGLFKKYTTLNLLRFYSFYSQHHFYSELRGPPAFHSSLSISI